MNHQSSASISQSPLECLVEIQSPNALRLNQWRIANDNQNWADAALDDSALLETEALPLKFRDQVAHQWIEAIERDDLHPIWYRRRIDCDFVPEDLAILIENGAILGDWTLFVNGQSIAASEFSPIFYHGADKIAANLSRLFVVGENCLVLRVENAPEMGGLRTPLHLMGSFSLGGDKNRTLQKLPTEAPFNDLVAAGLPHFSGAATYARDVHCSELGEILSLPRGFQEIAAVKIGAQSLGGQSLGARCWSPYRWEIPQTVADFRVRLEITLTNTLLPFIEGQFWDAPAQKLRDV